MRTFTEIGRRLVLALVVAALALSGLLLATPHGSHASAALASHAGFHADCGPEDSPGAPAPAGHQHDEAAGSCCLAAFVAGLPPARRIGVADAAGPSPAPRPEALVLAFDLTRTLYRPPSRLA